ncbi:hypothetical protein [Dyella sp. ASV21]|uniref:hypothetical protein n=1 Tax=Dyella sp. ASV21 TaxID=2795114 RepID=UPI0018EAC05E|nr:hypothetical protein [Dyella sp. ASV21]
MDRVFHPNAASSDTEVIAMNQPEDHKPRRPPGTSGYPEPQPTPSKPGTDMPDEKTPREPQNVPSKKPKPSS